MKKNINKTFYYTCDISNPIYSMLVGAAVIDAKNRGDKFIDKKRLERVNKISYKGVVFVFKALIGFSLFDMDRLAESRYNNLNIGRYVISSTLRDVYTNKNFILFYWAALKRLIRGVSIIDNAESVVGNAASIYIDHGVYLNGVLVELFLSKCVSVYMNAYPQSLVRAIHGGGRAVAYEELLLPIRKHVSTSEREYANDYISMVLDDPNVIPYMDVAMVNCDSEYPNKDVYVIYMHSFTDAQLIYGYDGFKGVYEWFLFTLQYLIKSGKRVIIKGHPNIFDDDPKHITKLMDKELFTYIVSRYGSDENIFIIDRPISNYGFLSSLDRSSVILVSHHGNSIVEGAAIGFKSISSSKSLWGGEFNISNVWNNRAEYSALLSMKHDELMSPSPDDVSDFVSVVYCNDVGFYGDKFWQNIVAKEFKCTRDDVRNNIAVLDGGVEKHTKVAHEISKNISERVVV